MAQATTLRNEEATDLFDLDEPIIIDEEDDDIELSDDVEAWIAEMLS